MTLHTYAECHYAVCLSCWVSQLSLLCWMSFMLSITIKSIILNVFHAVSQLSRLCWMSLSWMSLWWVSLCWMSLRHCEVRQCVTYAQRKFYQIELRVSDNKRWRIRGKKSKEAKFSILSFSLFFGDTKNWFFREYIKTFFLNINFRFS